MAKDLEKRIASRHPVEGPIVLRTMILSSREINAHLLNFSEQGICFTADTKLIPGTTILYKASSECHLFADNHADCQLRSMSMVTVKWCHESSAHGQSVYTIGATYMLPY